MESVERARINRISRRTFLAASATAAATLSAHGAGAPGRLRVGLLGPGRHGSALLREMDAFGSEHKADVVAVHRDSLDAVRNAGANAIIIATPDHLHAESALAALEAGLHVYCAAPMAMTELDAHAVRQAALDSGRVYRVGYESLHETRWQAARALVQSGVIGDVRWVSGTTHEFPIGFNDGWRTDTRFTNGAAAHHLHELWAACAYATGAALPSRVSAMGGGHETDAALPDGLCLSADFSNGAHFNLDCRPAPESAPHGVIRGSVASLIICHECIVAMPDVPADAPLEEVWRGDREWDGTPLQRWLRDIQNGERADDGVELAYGAAVGIARAMDAYRRHAA